MPRFPRPPGRDGVSVMSTRKESLVSFRHVGTNLDRPNLKSFAAMLREEVAAGREFHVRITDDVELRRLNDRFRGKAEPTDVLSFPAENMEFLGDIAISWQRAAAQARRFRHSLEIEIQVLILHGLLHLLGMDHESKRDRREMVRAEQDWRSRIGLPSGLIERARA